MVPSFRRTSMLGRSLQSEPGARGMWRIRASTKALMSWKDNLTLSLFLFSVQENVRELHSIYKSSHLADMVSEDWLILRASHLPLEPRLWFSIVRNLQRRRTVANLWQVWHGVPDSDGSVDSSVTPVTIKKKKSINKSIPRQPRRLPEKKVDFYITVWHCWRISFHPPLRSVNTLWVQTRAEVRGNEAAFLQELQPRWWLCDGSEPHRTDQPVEGGVVGWTIQALSPCRTWQKYGI